MRCELRDLMRRLLVGGALALGACSGCGGVDAMSIDAAPPPDTMAPPDAAPPPREARELTSAGGRAAGATYTLEYQLGHPFAQSASAGGGRSLEGGAAVKP